MNTETNQETEDENLSSEEKTNTEETTDTEESTDESIDKIADLEKELGTHKRDLKDLRKENEKLKNPPKETSDSQESEPNESGDSEALKNSQTALLNSLDVKHPDDQKVVLDEAKRLKLPIADILQMEHIKVELTKKGDERTSQEGMPKGQGRKGGPNKGDVDYYLAHPDETPDDLELHDKVITAKLKKEAGESKFSDVPFVG